MNSRRTDPQPQTAPETKVSGRRSVSPSDVVLRAVRDHGSYIVADFAIGGPDECICGAELPWSRYSQISEVHQEHQADAIVAALLREVLPC